MRLPCSLCCPATPKAKPLTAQCVSERRGLPRTCPPLWVASSPLAMVRGGGWTGRALPGDFTPRTVPLRLGSPRGDSHCDFDSDLGCGVPYYPSLQPPSLLQGLIQHPHPAPPSEAPTLPVWGSRGVVSGDPAASPSTAVRSLSQVRRPGCEGQHSWVPAQLPSLLRVVVSQESNRKPTFAFVLPPTLQNWRSPGGWMPWERAVAGVPGEAPK